MSQQYNPRSGRVANAIAAAALVLSVASLVVSFVQTQRALDISTESLRFAYDQQPQVNLDAHPYGAWTEDVTPGEGAQLFVLFALENTGEVELRGCLTYWGFTTEDGAPIMYYPSAVEPGGEVWSLAPGDNHESTVHVSVSRGEEIIDEGFVTLWFECSSPAVVTSRYLYGVDLRTGGLVDESPFGLGELEALSARQRTEILNERYGKDLGEDPSVDPFVFVDERD